MPTSNLDYKTCSPYFCVFKYTVRTIKQKLTMESDGKIYVTLFNSALQEILRHLTVKDTNINGRVSVTVSSYNSDDGSHKMTLIWVALGESFHLCRLKHHKNSKPQTEKKTLSPTEEGRIRWELIVFALTHWELKKARCQKTFSLLVRPFLEGSFFSIPSFRRMGQTKKTKCLAAKNAFFFNSFFKLIVFQIHHVLTDKRWQLPLWFLLFS